MKIKIILFSILISFSFTLLGQEQNLITIGKRYAIESSILNETRYYNIYFPPSYESSKHNKYPVIYLMDGDYNFHHTTGLIEQLSSISEQIPEMIVVGLVDNGHANYVKNCTPFDKKKNPDGQSEKFLNFLITELKPHIHSTFKAADYDILIGHSLGGLFVVNALLQQPEAFKAFVSISPSLWWKDFETIDKVKPFFEKHKQLNRSFFLSIGNEKGMGVFGFHNEMDVRTFEDEYYGNEPLGLDYTFQRFPEENHNSVGLVTVKQALRHLFKNYDLPSNDLKDLKTFQDYETKMKPYTQMIGEGFRFPERQLKCWK